MQNKCNAMSTKLNPREVLSHLNDLGYTNIDAKQLQAFIRDLKILMKYEERKANEQQLTKINILKELTDDYKPPSSILDKLKRTEVDALDATKHKKYQSLSESTLGLSGRENISKPQTVPKRVSNVSTSLKNSKPKQLISQSFESASTSTIACPVHFFRGIGCPDSQRSKSVGTACTCPIDASSQVSSSCVKEKNNNKGKRPVCSTIESKNETNTTCSQPDSFDDRTYFSELCPREKKTKKLVGRRNYTHDFTHPCYCPGSMKPRSAVIKCNIGCKPPFQKCDPVNLYKYYERQWRINRIPGENMPREQRFRWCFREKISCGPPVRLKKPLRKKYDIVLPIN